MESIAQEHGFFWETLWNLPENAELKQAREDPQCLLPGDRVTVPELRPKEEAGASEKRHRFRRKGVPSMLQIYVKQFGEARANEPYIADIDGDIRQGTTDQDGLVREAIPPNARHCTLTVGSGDGQMVLELELGGLDPVSEISGIQKRLDNLGFKCAVTGRADAQTEAAIKAFQKEQALAITGKPDQPTREALVKLHKG